MNKKENILNLLYSELVDYLQGLREKTYRATQIFEWIYQKGAWTFDEMKNLPNEFRDKLKQKYQIKPFQIIKKQISQDGTTKFLFQLEDGEKIETVLIPSSKRTTICLSTQAGCKFGCNFCASGIGGWQRDLSTAEILMQVLHAKEEAKNHKNPLSHLVYMGVGEPFDNFKNMMKSIRIINDKKGLNVGARRITVSTCGIIPKIKEFAKEGLQVELSISLHGYDNESRNILMPVNRKYPFHELMEACREYVKETNRQITFEYILIKDVTCTERAAQALKRAFKGIICKMNLIPYNSVSEFDYFAPSRQEIYNFQNRLEAIGIHATLRMPRGQDVLAACGQLRYK